MLWQATIIKTDNKKVTKIQDAESIKKNIYTNCAHFKDVLLVIHEHLLGKTLPGTFNFLNNERIYKSIKWNFINSLASTYGTRWNKNM